MPRHSVTPWRTAACAALCVLLGASSARAQQEARAVDVEVGIDGAITVGALAGALLMTFVPVDTGDRWRSEIFGSVDHGVRDNFSMSADAISDALIAGTIAAPVLLHIGGGLDDDAGRSLLLYGETLSVSLVANAVTKFLVQRPRPYNYHGDERVQRFARGEGKDSHTSFYSGHSSTAFAAAVGGAYLFAVASDDRDSKALIWMIQLGMATATANLRVRAGRHFYSDVVIGAVLGSAVGFLVPALHAEGGVYRPSGLELGAMAAGVVAGTLASELLPVDEDILTPIGAGTLRLVPMAHDSGAGLALAGEM